MQRRLWWFAALMCVAAPDASAANTCETAVLNYYCTAVTVALGKAAQPSNPALSAGLMTRAADYAKKAEKSGHANLRDKYYKRGVETAAQSTKPAIMKQIISVCVDVKPDAVMDFLAQTAGECR